MTGKAKAKAKPKARAKPKASSRRASAPDNVPSTARVNAARQLLPQARPVLLRFPHVQGVGVGLRRKGGQYTGEIAFVVTVDRKDDPERPRLDVHQKLPLELFGIPVDVQQVPMARLRMDVAGGGDVRRSGAASGGHIGIMARSGAGQVHALTAMHVFEDHLVVKPPGGSYFDVEARMFQGGYETIGSLFAGGFGVREDIANVALAANVGSDARLLGTEITLGKPRSATSLPATLDVQISVPGVDRLFGHLAGYPVDHQFPTANGFVMFHDLMHFRVEDSGIDQGWSGSVVFDPARSEPLTFISFGSDALDADGFSHVWGFPLAAHYEAWGLRPL